MYFGLQIHELSIFFRQKKSKNEKKTAMFYFDGIVEAFAVKNV